MERPLKDWINYPVSVIVSGLSTTVGAILLILLAIGFGTLLYGIAESSRHWPSLAEFRWQFVANVMGVIVVGLMFIGPACLQVWGLIYVGFLLWVFYRLIHDDVSKTYIALLVVSAQFFFLLIFTAILGANKDAAPGFLLRSVVIGLVLLLLCAAPFVVARFRSEATTQNSLSDSSPEAEANHGRHS